MTYKTYLKNKNLSEKTIELYLYLIKNWLNTLKERNPSKKIFTCFINSYAKKHSANSTRLIYSIILSYYKFKKQWKLVNDFKDIRLPKTSNSFKKVVDYKYFMGVINKINKKNWYNRRNALIMSLLFFTGIRVSELYKINKSCIENNQIRISGKGRKERIIYLPEELMHDLNKWTNNYICVKKNNKLLSYKQINVIVKNFADKYLKCKITPHSLRRSYATHLSKNNLDIKSISILLGHSNINTTARYINTDENYIVNKIESIFSNK
ncbi:MAG: tyrosine-type recombinase/integrase [Ureaplasma sp.]|nr:tyrosine-type recombinase/integrase [Ureaplasma sp.]